MVGPPVSETDPSGDGPDGPTAPGWAIVVGIDDYGAEEPQLRGAVRDALAFRSWVTSSAGGGVSERNCHLLLGRRADDLGRDDAALEPTKDNIVAALNEVVAAAEAVGRGARLYFYFSGHGITAELAGREESALVMRGFDAEHPSHSLAVRSLAEHLETTPIDDQFFFVDACRNRPRQRYAEIGRWPIPRRRDPGQPPVQQFILHATSPGLRAVEVGSFDEAGGAFTSVLMEGLAGDGHAKAWSWDRGCYEVRWERLATYVNRKMRQQSHVVGGRLGPSAGRAIQIPQDAGSRGVAHRDRDPCLASYDRARFADVELTLEVKADPPFGEAEVSVIDAVGTPVLRTLRAPGSTVSVPLAPRTYAARVVTTDSRTGSVKAPIELYEAISDTIELRREDGPPPALPGPDPQSLGTIEVLAEDPLSTAGICDEAGRMAAVCRAGEEHDARPGFYRVRHLDPERRLGDDVTPEAGTDPESEGPAVEAFVTLAARERRLVRLVPPAPGPFVVRLAEALGGGCRDGHVFAYPGAEGMAWAQPSTVLAAGIAGALGGEVAMDRLGVGVPSPDLLHGVSGVALYAVAGDGRPEALSGLRARLWPTGSTIPPDDHRLVLEPSEHAVAGVVMPLQDTVPHWLSIERAESATVLTLPIQPGRLAVVVLQVDPERTRIYQFHPRGGRSAPSRPPRLRRQEHLERLLLSGALDGARPLAEELAQEAAADPFAGLLAGYVLLRLGLHDQLGPLATAVLEAAPTSSDAYILRGEAEARAGRSDAAHQAFADAVNTGIPAFGEGLTRLVEGLRASGYDHPRGWLVRHIFRRHVRGTMWSAFAPSRPLLSGELVIAGTDLGYEG
jgi:hypothetical protein